MRRALVAAVAAVAAGALTCPGGQDVLIGLGFRTKVMEFEEFWVCEEFQLRPILGKDQRDKSSRGQSLGDRSIVLES